MRIECQTRELDKPSKLLLQQFNQTSSMSISFTLKTRTNHVTKTLIALGCSPNNVIKFMWRYYREICMKSLHLPAWNGTHTLGSVHWPPRKNRICVQFALLFCVEKHLSGEASGLDLREPWKRNDSSFTAHPMLHRIWLASSWWVFESRPIKFRVIGASGNNHKRTRGCICCDFAYILPRFSSFFGRFML